jgi:periplasmic protein CpxP/Spy
MNINTKKKKLLLASGLALSMIAVAGVAVAGPSGGPKGRGGFPGMMMLRLYADLDLSEQQELKVIRARRDLKAQAQEARKDTQASIGVAIEELNKANPDSQKMHSIADEAIKRFSKIVHSGIDQALDIHASLTPEQRAKLVERAREIQERRSHHFDRSVQDRGDREKKPAKR